VALLTFKTVIGVVEQKAMNVPRSHIDGPVDVPTPSCPALFNPQHWTLPPASVAHE
jgi:hypothetical protein